MSRYRCASCRFQFQTGRIPKKCPYCGKEGSVMAEESAEELVRDVDKMF
ncbi:MAG: hypothetical protein V1660_01485 [archaeon]